jgi:hypothetical protein
MKLMFFLAASLLLFCFSSIPAFAQQSQGTVTLPTFATSSLGKPTEPPDVQWGESSVVVRINTIALSLPEVKAHQEKPKTGLRALASLTETAIQQHKRFREMGVPMEFEGSGLYFRRDLYGATKGIILRRFFKDRLDVGLYKRRFQPTTTQITGQLWWPGVAEATNKSYVFSGGRQIFVGVRLKLDRIFH